MKISENILNLIENMTLIELNNLVSVLEKKYNIKNNFDSGVEKKDIIDNNKKINYSIYLTDLGKNKVSVIKIIKEFNNLGLKEAKDLVESFPVLIKNNIDDTTANLLKDKLEKVGAKVDIKNE